MLQSEEVTAHELPNLSMHSLHCDSFLVTNNFPTTKKVRPSNLPAMSLPIHVKVEKWIKKEATG